jgi:hypothetical protein
MQRASSTGAWRVRGQDRAGREKVGRSPPRTARLHSARHECDGTHEFVLLPSPHAPSPLPLPGLEPDTGHDHRPSNAARRSASPTTTSPLATYPQVHATTLPAAGTVSTAHTHTHTHTRPPPPPPPHTPPPSPTRHPAPPYRPTARTPSVPAPPYGATSPRQSHRLRRPSTTAVFPRASSPRSTMGAPHHGCTPPSPFPALHAARPLSQWAHADRSRDRPCPHPPLLCLPCVRRLSLLRGDSHYMGTQSGASPRPFVVSVVHTMNTMAGATQFSRG